MRLPIVAVIGAALASCANAYGGGASASVNGGGAPTASGSGQSPLAERFANLQLDVYVTQLAPDPRDDGHASTANPDDKNFELEIELPARALEFVDHVYYSRVFRQGPEMLIGSSNQSRAFKVKAPLLHFCQVPDFMRKAGFKVDETVVVTLYFRDQTTLDRAFQCYLSGDDGVRVRFKAK